MSLLICIVGIKATTVVSSAPEHCLKHLILCSKEQINSSRFVTTNVRVRDDKTSKARYMDILI